MIPNFPKFKPLTFEDKHAVEQFSSKYPPSSDYNFAGLWSYNVKEQINISQLNENLILFLFDYVTDEPIYSFMGSNQVLKTSDRILNYLAKNNLTTALKLIPEYCINSSKEALKKEFKITEDTDNFDYILGIEQLIGLKGNNYKDKRQSINKFQRTFPNHQIIQTNIAEPEASKEIFDIFSKWESNKNCQVEAEKASLKRLIKSADHFNLATIGVYIDNSLIGFSISEILDDKYAIGHYQKADVNYNGIFPYLVHTIAQHLFNHGCLYLNIEQDLGIPGLRQQKNSWNPMKFLVKYIISPK